MKKNISDVHLHAFVLIGLLLLSACGGGSGGGNTSDENLTESPGDESPDTTQAEPFYVHADALFPPANANLGGVETFSMSGTLLDDPGYAGEETVNFVSVNGAYADLPLESKSVWQVPDLPLEPGNVTLSGVVESGSGHQVSFERHVKNEVFLATPGEMVVAPSGEVAYIKDFSTKSVVSMNLADYTLEVVSGPDLGSGPDLTSLRGIANYGNKLIVLEQAQRAVIEIDPATGNRTLLSDDDTNNNVVGGDQIGAGPGFASPSCLIAQGDKAWVCDTYYDQIFEIDLLTGDRQVISGDGIGTGPSFSNLTDGAYYEGALVVSDFYLDALIHVDLETGDRQILSGDGVGTGIALDVPQSVAIKGDTAYVCLFTSDADVVRVDLATGDRSVVTGHGLGVGDGAPLDKGDDLAINGDQLLISDSMQNAIFTVDPVDGGRAMVAQSNVGEGTQFEVPRHLVSVADKGKLVVTDGNQNALFTIDVATGDREELTALYTYPGPHIGGPNRVQSYGDDFVLLDNTQKGVIFVDGDTGHRSWITGGGVGTGPEFDRPVAMAVDGDIIYVADYKLNAVFKVNALTGEREIIADSSVGTGPDFQNTEAIVVHGDRLLLYDDLQRQVLDIDPETGNREVLSGVGSEYGERIKDPKDMVVYGDQLLLVDVGYGSVFSMNLETGYRKLLSGYDWEGANTGRGPRLGQPVGIDVIDDTAYILDSRMKMVMALDLREPVTGDRVIIAQ